MSCRPADSGVSGQYLKDDCPGGVAQLPANTFLLDRPGLARVMSLPLSGDTFASPYLQSYRLPQGILHNPKSDRRTTQGIFHIVEGGLPVPADKLAVPKRTFAALLAAALRPPASLLTLPFTADQSDPVRLFVSLLLRPAGVPGHRARPAQNDGDSLFRAGQPGQQSGFRRRHFWQRRRSVSAGKRRRARRDALDRPHRLRDRGAASGGNEEEGSGPAARKDATERQRRDGMCWRDPDEPYNGGGAFKVACRDERGVMVTIIADNYYGYCKKEVKTQISFAANLYGLCEEEHAGGAIAFATYVLGQEFRAGNAVSLKKARFSDAMRLLGPMVEDPAGRLRGRPQVSEYLLRAGRFRVQRARGFDPLDRRRARLGA